ncbi:enoyl-CoA hydratase/isomerase family protein [Kaustia mangrovi]|uniref:3-hydroxyisobutyryl-CoA hydrolase n=1 Tax=Kaustia mangrovi TaxID=2593653 RepID=A0A7S8C7P3_9HYPH|nr:enoyl-CoA hydratase/isomerase family protein [Kaustia mangrovi]QPC44897.1 enoyl-CoA hydratase/isomerase family protein [Kaustia mangrovi]
MSEAEVLFETRGRAGIVTLNRPKALNALTLDMIREIHPVLERWAGDDRIGHVIVRAAGEKAFCAGGDIRKLYDWGREGHAIFLRFYWEEYRLNAAIKRFPKPYVALLDGITMGGGVGLSVHGSHRVASERLTFAMPETGIGLFPDVGGTYFLPRCPGETGLYLGLTGARLKVADALHAGIATHHVPSDRLDALTDALCATGDVDATVGDFCAEAGDAPLVGLREKIDRHFGRDSVEAILESLDADGGDWAENTAETVRGKSPTSLAIAYRQLREGAEKGFEDCMRLEYRIVNRIFRGHDFYEGIRAVVIDKDLAPRWDPPVLEAVDPNDIARYFAPLDEELSFD